MSSSPAAAVAEPGRDTMNRTGRRLLKVFVTGLLAALPLAATLLIFVWGARLVVEYVGPQSIVGGGLLRIGLGITGSEVVAYSIGVLVVMIAIFLLGWYVYHAMTGSWGFGIGEDEQFIRFGQLIVLDVVAARSR